MCAVLFSYFRCQTALSEVVSTRLACRSNYLFIYLFNFLLFKITSFINLFHFFHTISLLIDILFLKDFCDEFISRIFRFYLLTKFLKLRMTNFFSQFAQNKHILENWNLLKSRKNVWIIRFYPLSESVIDDRWSFFGDNFFSSTSFFKKLFFTSFSKFSLFVVFLAINWQLFHGMRRQTFNILKQSQRSLFFTKFIIFRLKLFHEFIYFTKGRPRVKFNLIFSSVMQQLA